MSKKPGSCRGVWNSNDKRVADNAGAYKAKPTLNPEVLISREAFEELGRLRLLPSYMLSSEIRKCESKVIEELLSAHVLFRLQTGNMLRYGLRKHLLPLVFVEGTSFIMNEEEVEETLSKCRKATRKKPPRPNLIDMSLFEGELEKLVALVHLGEVAAKRDKKNTITKFYLEGREKGD